MDQGYADGNIRRTSPRTLQGVLDTSMAGEFKHLHQVRTTRICSHELARQSHTVADDGVSLRR